MIEGLFYVHVHVADLARAKRFYTEGLGWRLDTDEPGVAGLWFGQGYVVLTQDTRPDAERRYAGGLHVVVRVGDLESQHGRLASRGVSVTPIQTQPWGERNFSFTDPDGYTWQYGAPAR